ncbi:hypothetical protein P910_002799 [Xylella fastidiosa Mul-MD]|nr:hypothetical protein P910_002799 [Xylella fastidiosa Mul-MD]
MSLLDSLSSLNMLLSVCPGLIVTIRHVSAVDVYCGGRGSANVAKLDSWVGGLLLDKPGMIVAINAPIMANSAMWIQWRGVQRWLNAAGNVCLSL